MEWSANDRHKVSIFGARQRRHANLLTTDEELTGMDRARSSSSRSMYEARQVDWAEHETRITVGLTGDG